MIKYRIERINVSDDHYSLTMMHVSDGSFVKKGDILFSYESSKADRDVAAEEAGYVFFNPEVNINNQYDINYIVAVVSPLAERPIKEDAFESDQTPTRKVKGVVGEKLVSKKAQLLIDQYGIDLSKLNFEIINEEIVRNYLLGEKHEPTFQEMSYYINRDIRSKPKLAVIGAGKAALQLLDAVYAAQKHEIVVFYDANPKIVGGTLWNCPIKALNTEEILRDFQSGIFQEIIISFSGNIMERRRWFESLQQHQIPIANIVHPTAYIGLGADMGIGNLLFAFTRIGPFASIGDNNVLSSYCSIEHHNKLGSHNTFGPSVITSGSCTIGDVNKFGTGIFIEPNIHIGNGCIISSGCVVQNIVPTNSVLRNKNEYEIKPLKERTERGGLS